MHEIWNISHADTEFLVTAYKSITLQKCSTKHTEESYSAFL
jgi:hypothetical protein